MEGVVEAAAAAAASTPRPPTAAAAAILPLPPLEEAEVVALEIIAVIHVRSSRPKHRRIIMNKIKIEVGGEKIMEDDLVHHRTIEKHMMVHPRNHLDRTHISFARNVTPSPCQEYSIPKRIIIIFYHLTSKKISTTTITTIQK